MPLKQVYPLATRSVKPQGTIIRHSSNHIGNHIIAHSDNVGIGIGNKTLQVVGSIMTAN